MLLTPRSWTEAPLLEEQKFHLSMSTTVKGLGGTERFNKLEAPISPTSLLSPLERETTLSRMLSPSSATALLNSCASPCFRKDASTTSGTLFSSNNSSSSVGSTAAESPSALSVGIASPTCVLPTPRHFLAENDRKLAQWSEEGLDTDEDRQSRESRMEKYVLRLEAAGQAWGTSFGTAFLCVRNIWDMLEVLDELVPFWSQYSSVDIAACSSKGLVSNAMYHRLAIQAAPSFAFLLIYYVILSDLKSSLIEAAIEARKCQSMPNEECIRRGSFAASFEELLHRLASTLNYLDAARGAFREHAHRANSSDVGLSCDLVEPSGIVNAEQLDGASPKSQNESGEPKSEIVTAVFHEARCSVEGGDSRDEDTALCEALGSPQNRGDDQDKDTAKTTLSPPLDLVSKEKHFFATSEATYPNNEKPGVQRKEDIDQNQLRNKIVPLVLASRFEGTQTWLFKACTFQSSSLSSVAQDKTEVYRALGDRDLLFEKIDREKVLKFLKNDIRLLRWVTDSGIGSSIEAVYTGDEEYKGSCGTRIKDSKKNASENFANDRFQKGGYSARDITHGLSSGNKGGFVFPRGGLVDGFLPLDYPSDHTVSPEVLDCGLEGSSGLWTSSSTPSPPSRSSTRCEQHRREVGVLDKSPTSAQRGNRDDASLVQALLDIEAGFPASFDEGLESQKQSSEENSHLKKTQTTPESTTRALQKAAMSNTVELATEGAREGRQQKQTEYSVLFQLLDVIRSALESPASSVGENGGGTVVFSHGSTPCSTNGAVDSLYSGEGEQDSKTQKICSHVAVISPQESAKVDVTSEPCENPPRSATDKLSVMGVSPKLLNEPCDTDETTSVDTKMLSSNILSLLGSGIPEPEVFAKERVERVAPGGSSAGQNEFVDMVVKDLKLPGFLEAGAAPFLDWRHLVACLGEAAALTAATSVSSTSTASRPGHDNLCSKNTGDSEGEAGASSLLEERYSSRPSEEMPSAAAAAAAALLSAAAAAPVLGPHSPSRFRAKDAGGHVSEDGCLLLPMSNRRTKTEASLLRESSPGVTPATFPASVMHGFPGLGSRRGKTSFGGTGLSVCGSPGDTPPCGCFSYSAPSSATVSSGKRRRTLQGSRSLTPKTESFTCNVEQQKASSNLSFPAAIVPNGGEMGQESENVGLHTRAYRPDLSHSSHQKYKSPVQGFVVTKSDRFRQHSDMWAVVEPEGGIRMPWTERLGSQTPLGSLSASAVYSQQRKQHSQQQQGRNCALQRNALLGSSSSASPPVSTTHPRNSTFAGGRSSPRKGSLVAVATHASKDSGGGNNSTSWASTSFGNYSSADLATPCQGVCWDPTHQRWVAHWSDAETHQRIRKYFNPKLLGFERARLHAILTRKEAVDSGRASMMIKSSNHHHHNTHNNGSRGFTTGTDTKLGGKVRSTAFAGGRSNTGDGVSWTASREGEALSPDLLLSGASVSGIGSSKNGDSTTSLSSVPVIPSDDPSDATYLRGVYWSASERAWYAHWKPADAHDVQIAAFPVADFLPATYKKKPEDESNLAEARAESPELERDSTMSAPQPHEYLNAVLVAKAKALEHRDYVLRSIHRQHQQKNGVSLTTPASPQLSSDRRGFSMSSATTPPADVHSSSVPIVQKNTTHYSHVGHGQRQQQQLLSPLDEARLSHEQLFLHGQTPDRTQIGMSTLTEQERLCEQQRSYATSAVLNLSSGGRLVSSSASNSSSCSSTSPTPCVKSEDLEDVSKFTRQQKGALSLAESLVVSSGPKEKSWTGREQCKEHRPAMNDVGDSGGETNFETDQHRNVSEAAMLLPPVAALPHSGVAYASRGVNLGLDSPPNRVSYHFNPNENVSGIADSAARSGSCTSLGIHLPRSAAASEVVVAHNYPGAAVNEAPHEPAGIPQNSDIGTADRSTWTPRAFTPKTENGKISQPLSTEKLISGTTGVLEVSNAFGGTKTTRTYRGTLSPQSSHSEASQAPSFLDCSRSWCPTPEEGKEKTQYAQEDAEAPVRRCRKSRRLALIYNKSNGTNYSSASDISTKEKLYTVGFSEQAISANDNMSNTVTGSATEVERRRASIQCDPHSGSGSIPVYESVEVEPTSETLCCPSSSSSSIPLSPLSAPSEATTALAQQNGDVTRLEVSSDVREYDACTDLKRTGASETQECLENECQPCLSDNNYCT